MFVFCRFPKQLTFQAPKQAVEVLAKLLSLLKNTLLLNKYHQVQEDVNLHLDVYAGNPAPTFDNIQTVISTFYRKYFELKFKMPPNRSTTVTSIPQSHYNLLTRVR